MARKNNMEVLISADSSKMTAAISNAKKALSEFSTDAEKLDNVQKRFEKIENSAMPLQRKLKALQQLMAEMNLNDLSNTDVFNELAQQAGTYADAIGDARQAVAQFANDNMNLKATAEGFQFLTGSVSVLSGAMGMLGVENDKVEQAMLQVQSAIALVNGVTSIANILNKDSALMLKLKALRATALTAAEKANTTAEQQNTIATIANTTAITANATVTGGTTIATGANTISTVANSVATTANTTARRIWNMTVAVSKALLGDFTGLVLLGAAALTTYALCTDNSTDSTEKNNNAVRYSKKVIKEYSEELASTMKKNVERVKQLSKEFNSLQNEASKTEWINKNKSELDNLGVSIKDLINLDSEFKNSNSSVISAIENRAKTITTLNQIHKKYVEETATKSGELVGKFMSLKREWDNLKSTGEKTEWIKNNQTEFANLGLSVGDLSTAERIFVNDTAKVVKALEARAQAMAAQTAMTDAYSQYYKQKFNNANSVEGGGFYKKASAGQEITKEQSTQILKEIGSYTRNGEFLYNDGYFTEERGKRKLTEKGANALNEKRQQEAKERRATNDARAEEELTKKTTFFTKEIEKNTENIKSLGLDKVVNPTEKGNSSIVSNGGKSSNSKAEKIDYLVSVDDGSLDVAEKKLSAWQNQLKITPVTDKEGIKKCQEEINKWTKEKINRQLIIEGKIDPKLIKETETLEKDIQNLEGIKNLSDKKINLDIQISSNKEELDNINSTLDNLKSKKLELEVNGSVEELEEITEMINKLSDKKINIETNIQTLIEESNSVKSEIESLRDETIRISIEADKEELNEINSQLEALQSKEIELMIKGSVEDLENVKNEIIALTEQRNLIQLKVEADTSSLEDIEKLIQDKRNQLLINYIKIGYEVEIEKGSKTDLENDLKELQKTRDILLRTKADPKLIKEIDTLIKNKKEDIEKEDIRLGIRPEIQVGSLNEIKKRIKEKEEEINLALNTNISPESMRKMQSELEALRKEEEAKEIELGIKENTPTIKRNETKFERGSAEDIQQSHNNAMANFEDVRVNYKLGLIGKEEATTQIEEINKKLASIGDKTINVTVNDDGSIQTKAEQMAQIGNIAEGVGNSFNSLSSALGSFSDNEDLAKASLIASAIGQLTLSFAQSMKGAFTPWDWMAAAVGGLAVLTSTVAQFQRFENGGIVGGNSYYGDKLLVRANSGELVLNRHQQKNLYNSMENAEIGKMVSSNVKVTGELTCKGSTLKACLNNYDSKMSKIK